LHTAAFILQDVAKKFRIEISPEQESMVYFVGQVPIRYKMLLDRKCSQQVENFSISVVKFPMKAK